VADAFVATWAPFTGPGDVAWAIPIEIATTTSTVTSTTVVRRRQ
jgi:hypothetical protein